MASALALKASSSRTVVPRPARSANGSQFFVKRSPLFSGRVQVEASAAAPTTVDDVNDENFDSIVRKSDIPVLVDFWAPWCGPCRFIAPLIDEIALEYKGKLKVVKLDTDKSPATATELGIRSIPTVMIFKNGEKQDLVIGAVPKATLIQTIEKYL